MGEHNIMKHTDKIKYAFLGAAIMLCTLVLAPDVIASAYMKIIEVSSNVKITIDDEEFIPTDVNGNEVEAFIYEGTTYLPVRAISEFSGFDVLWDNSSKTVKLYLNKAKPDSSDAEQYSETSFEDQVLQLVNEIRADNHLTKLSKDTTLIRAADKRAKELKSKFAHKRPDGAEWHTVLGETGVSFGIAGENLAMGYTSASEVVEAWMNSEGHRENILESRFDRIGISHYVDSNGIHYWTQLFAGD